MAMMIKRKTIYTRSLDGYMRQSLPARLPSEDPFAVAVSPTMVVRKVHERPQNVFQTAMSDVKGLDASQTKFDGSDLRVGIVHARWNAAVVKSLLDGAVRKLHESGVKPQNIVIQNVPGSYELPFACKK